MGFDAIFGAVVQQLQLIFGLAGVVQQVQQVRVAQVQVDRITGFMGIRKVGGRQVGNHIIYLALNAIRNAIHRHENPFQETMWVKVKQMQPLLYLSS